MDKTTTNIKKILTIIVGDEKSLTLIKTVATALDARKKMDEESKEKV